MRVYLLHSEADDNGTLLITSPAFPEVTPFAKDEADIAQVAAAAIEEAIAARIRDGKESPGRRPRESFAPTKVLG